MAVAADSYDDRRAAGAPAFKHRLMGDSCTIIVINANSWRIVIP